MSRKTAGAGALAVPAGVFHEEPLTFWHDIRQALATISALSVAAETDPKLSAETRRRLALIRAEVRNIHELSDQVGALQAAPPDGPVPLHELVHPLVDAGAAAHDVHAEIRSTPAYVMGTTVGMRRVVSNLAENACKAAGSGGRVVASVRTDGSHAVLEIGDSGPGFNGRLSRPERLGLAIIESLAMAYRGSVEFGESGEGGGLVRVILPAAGPPAARLEDAARPEPAPACARAWPVDR
jgi:signal transduction histidine kinase